MSIAIYKQYEVGTGTTGQSWPMAQWRPRQDAAWPTVNRIGYGPNACRLVNYEGSPYLWVDNTTMPALLRCDFDDMAFNEILGNSDDMRRFIYKYEKDDSWPALKQHCGKIVTVNGKQIPRYLHPSDTFCKSAIVGQDYAEFADEICNANPTAEYCACYNRSRDPAFMADGNIVPYEDAVCWYKPCVFNNGLKDPRLTSTCETDICPRVVTGSNVSVCK